ncbi:hypothetical protein AMAG_19303 [Allomyces macrogynus ATCC 38327]|uniref:Tyrosine specific protein phosphatases domain-containing protein n=1 Tax=Allomyces macrogynus (strain ATCC 38327) TaxID=578462 RepID=A0A0L0SUA4_ALLM3|nr:hypothetical protein AMAG_19303 [Allomyces macrogynus ATCC 38327]|eukprot:KNE65955.1 hypothetical protein AMAG_19303 [Allomyces macrogynus ATCC 38327]
MDKAVQSVVADSDRLRLETWTCVARIVLCDGCPPNPTCAAHAGESFPLPAAGRRAPPPPCPVAPMAAKLASAPARLSVLKGGFAAFAKACPAYVESSTVPGTPIAQKDGFALRMAALPTPTLQLNAPPLASARARTPATSTRPSSTEGTPSVAGSRVVPPSPFADPPAARSPFADPPAVRSPFADPPALRSPFADPPGLGAMRSPVRTPGSVRSPGPSTPGRERPPSLAARRGFNATLSTPGGTSSAASTASTPGPGLFTGKPASLHRRKPRPPNLNLALSSSSSGWPPPPLPGLPQAKQLKLLCTLAAKDLPPTAPKWLHDLFASGGIISELQTKFMGVLMADGRVNSPTLALSSKNRYGNVFPFQHNRVQLLHRDPELGPSEADSDYINASYIRVNSSVLPAAIDHPDPCPMFLATQAPLPHTTRDFWAMVRDQECPVIVNLAASMDHSRGSAHGYWPENIETPLVYVVEGGRELEVQLVSEAVAIVSDGIDDPPPSVTLRRLRVSTTPPGRSIDVAHVSVEGWEDGNIPSVDSALAVVRLLRDELDTALIVHCSAGCGRTGTFVAVYALAVRWLDLTRPLPKVILPVDTDPVPPLVRHLREQRMMMVQTHTQFMFLYEVLVSWATLGYNPIVPQFSITVPPIEEVASRRRQLQNCSNPGLHLLTS